MGDEQMDRLILKQYTSLRKEVEDEERRIRAMNEEICRMCPAAAEVTDIVTRGKRGKKPLGTVTIHGVWDESKINLKRARLRERKAKQELQKAVLENLIADCEECINQVEDSELRRMLRFRYIENKETWKEVADAMGEGYEPNMCKQRVSRFMRGKCSK